MLPDLISKWKWIEMNKGRNITKVQHWDIIEAHLLDKDKDAKSNTRDDFNSNTTADQFKIR